MARKNRDIFALSHKGVYKNANLVVMFFDVIGFTKNTNNDDMKDCVRNIENAIYDELYEAYNWNETYVKNDLILIPTGDGYSIAFHPSFKDDDILEIVKKFYCRLRGKLKFSIRVGIAKGPCQIYRDQNERNNVFGYGINLANRVMGLAGKNQILIHEDLALEILHQRSHSEIHEIKGKNFVIKHGEAIRVYNFYGTHEGEEFGNKQDPTDPIVVE